MADNTKASPLGFTKLVVSDLDKAALFYQSVCGLTEDYREEEVIAGRPTRELIFKADPAGSGTLVLTEFVGSPRPGGQSVILGFMTDDIDRFMERAVSGGGRIVEAAHLRADHNLKMGFVVDLEGNLIQVIELL